MSIVEIIIKQLWGRVAVKYLTCLFCVAFLVYLTHWGAIGIQAY